ncbi:hypothetical protein [Amycolatopsis sp. WQ 127309]|nr:hypothetical protein [Amycolatopsis sp. WQ 127309]UOZ03857.1 hypothetical protein MUY22_34080 [Amycolatopsis sp. WQ 127309]
MTRVTGSGGAGRTGAALSTVDADDAEDAWQRHAVRRTPNGEPPAHRVRE